MKKFAALLALVSMALGLITITASAQLFLLQGNESSLKQTSWGTQNSYFQKFQQQSFWKRGTTYPYDWETRDYPTGQNPVNYYDYYRWPDWTLLPIGAHWLYINNVLQPGYPISEGGPFPYYNGGLGEHAGFTNTVTQAPGFTNYLSRIANSKTELKISTNGLWRVHLHVNFIKYDRTHAQYYGLWDDYESDTGLNPQTMSPTNFSIYDSYNQQTVPINSAGNVDLIFSQGTYLVTPVIGSGTIDGGLWYTWDMGITGWEPK